jgi:selT/selW/selH-like putative selenoprotein
LSAKLLETFKMQITGLNLIPDKGGCFEVKANGELLYSKLATNEFPDEGLIVEAVQKRMK